MKKLLIFAAALALMIGAGSFFLGSLGQTRPGFLPTIPMSLGSQSREVQRPLGSFDTVVLSGSGKLVIRIGQEASITIRARENMLDTIRSDIKGPVLLLGFNGNTSSSIEYELVVPSLKAISIAGSGDVVVEDELRGTELRIDIGGSGSANLKASVSKLGVNLAGSGKVNITGKTDILDVKLLGSGDLDAADFDGKNAILNILGSGNVRIGSYQSIEANILGSGDILYKGTPKIKEQSPGSGRIKRIP